MKSMEYVLVTGAFGGMGREAVRTLRAAGYGVFALDRKTDTVGDGVIPIEADLTKEDDVARAFASVSAVTDRLFAIVHFAGIYMLDSLVEMSETDFKRIFAVNLFGVFTVNRVFLPLLSNGSRILITTSELAPLDPLPFTGIYAVTKGALDRYAYALRMELQMLGISVSVLRAGAVDTGMIGASTDALDRFCEKTEIYTCNAGRFRDIVNRVEARKIPPARIAHKVEKLLLKKHPRFAYAINRNPLLLLLNALPQSLQCAVIARILKSK